MAGRKRDSAVWDYFSYDDKMDKSRCLVQLGNESRKQCDAVFAGKNTSNLIAHLGRFHKTEHDEYLENEKEKRIGKVGIKRKIGCDSELGGEGKSQTIKECLHRRIVFWPTESSEHKQRQSDVIDMLVSSNSPMTLIDDKGFRKMMKNLDPKFKLPGKLLLVTNIIQHVQKHWG